MTMTTPGADGGKRQLAASRPGVRRTAWRLAAGTVLMFGLGFALVPLYEVFCEVTGLNGKTDANPAAAYRAPTGAGMATVERTVRVQFLAINNGSMPWQFRAPAESELRISPGAAPVQLSYYARNGTDRDMVAQAVPSVSPGRAAKHLRKVECFCFERQPLAAGEEAQLPLRFYLSPELPEDIDTITLSYTLFDVSELAAAGTAAGAGRLGSRGG